MRKILFIGAPGSGKGTQAEILKKYGFVPLSVGNLVKRAISDEDPLVLPYRKKMESGELLPDEVIFSLVKKETGKINSPGYILDGFARNISQAEKAIKMELFDEVFFFDLSESEAVKRIRKRAKKEKRIDDAEEVVKNRFGVFNKETLPAVRLLRKKIKNFFVIDASPSVEKIHDEVVLRLHLK
jgi:adenylate kinase